MEREWQKRIEQLEQEVIRLQTEVALLKQNNETHKQQPIIKPQLQAEALKVEGKTLESVENKKIVAVTVAQKQQDSEEKTEKQAALKMKEPVQKPIAPKPTKSFEERITNILPKLFMLILVLGILWGLKLASEFGFLSDTVKVMLAYIVSIVIGVYAWRLEKKKEALTAMIVSLYGGAFIIGILATAAGAILYEVFTLIVALVIAILYITYGIAISYLKGSQALTGFVVFTSLLLPYLLEYMDFNKVFILIYIILIFGAIQLVILQHKQQIALYVAMFFSLLAIQIIWLTQFNQTLYFALSYIIILALFLNSWWQLFKRSEKWKVVQEGALFSVSSFTLLLLNIIIFDEPYQIGYLLVVFALYTVMAFIVYKENEHHVFDITATIALLLTFNIVLTFDFAQGYSELALVLSVFAGIMLAIRLRAPFMKITYSALLFIMAFALYITTDVQPFWHVENIALLLLIISLVSAYIYAKMPKGELTRFERLTEKYYVIDSIAAAIVLYVMFYSVKLDYAYISTTQSIPYAVFILTAICSLVILVVDQRWIGRFVPFVLMLCYLTQSITLLMTGLVNETLIALQLVTRATFILVLLALLVDLYKKGLIYQKWQRFIEKYIEAYISLGMLIMMLHFINLTSNLYIIDTLTWGIATMIKTLILFATASIAILLGRRRQWKTLRTMGFVLLLIAILKLIFFDLATLNLLIRAILFIVIGTAGMLLSGRLGRK
ncbi:DUF2339 domain-containing protein [Bacillus ndiopicus]|uniref:DUF2339 domain-containing protein n=1 Tax=Bacillus ndiopicus TaxID=1347368 RepID=UPI0005A72E88|nr:DUF2339 domain-containing protein [Bacillus ndiopicus]